MSGAGWEPFVLYICIYVCIYMYTHHVKYVYVYVAQQVSSRRMLFDARVTHAGASTTSKDASQCRLFFHFVYDSLKI